MVNAKAQDAPIIRVDGLWGEETRVAVDRLLARSDMDTDTPLWRPDNDQLTDLYLGVLLDKGRNVNASIPQSWGRKAPIS